MLPRFVGLLLAPTEDTTFNLCGIRRRILALDMAGRAVRELWLQFFDIEYHTDSGASTSNTGRHIGPPET
jgi:hypothetical protein